MTHQRNEILHDPINYLYFHFLSPVSSEFKRVNAHFQATDAEATEVVKELNLFYNSLRGRGYNSSGVSLPTDKVDYGAKFIFEADALIHRMKNEMMVRRVWEVYSRCHMLLLEAAEQVKQHLPPSKDIFNSLSYLPPSCVPVIMLPMQHLMRRSRRLTTNVGVSCMSTGKRMEFLKRAFQLMLSAFCLVYWTIKT